MSKDWLSKLFGWLDHNRYTVGSVLFVVIALAIFISQAGCQSLTYSPADPGDGVPVKVTRAELAYIASQMQTDFAAARLQLELESNSYNQRVAAFNDRLTAAAADLDKQDEFRADLMAAVQSVALEAAGGALNPASLIPLGIGLIGGAWGIGTKLDNSRKDTVITALKATPVTTPEA